MDIKITMHQLGQDRRACYSATVAGMRFQGNIMKSRIQGHYITIDVNQLSFYNRKRLQNAVLQEYAKSLASSLTV